MKSIIEYIKNLFSKIFGKQETKLLEEGMISDDKKIASTETENKRDFLSEISLHSYFEEENLLKNVGKNINTIAFLNEKQLEMLDKVIERKMSELK